MKFLPGKRSHPNPVASDLARLIGKGASRVSEVAHFDVSQAGETYRIKLKRSAAARRFILRFREATQDLVLTIPARAKLIDAKRFAEKQAPWIGSRLRRSPETLRLSPVLCCRCAAFRTGSTIDR